MTDRQAMQDAAAKEQEEKDKAANAKTWKPKEAGEELYGVLLEGEWVTTKYGDTRVLTIEDEKDEVHTVWCGDTMMKNELNAKNPRVGSTVLLQYLGKQQPKTAGGNAYNGWNMQVVDSDVQHWAESFDRMEMKKKQRGAEQGYAAPADGLEAPY